MRSHLSPRTADERNSPANEEQLRLVIDTIPGLVWTARPDGSADYFNRRWTDFAGLSLDEVVSRGWQTVVHPEDLPELEECWKASLQTGGEAETEARLRRHDGVYRWFLFRAVPLTDESGRVIKWYGQNTDIDDKKRGMIWLAGEKKIQQMIASRASLPATLEEICTLAERLAEGVKVSILLLSPDGKHLLSGAGPSLPNEYRAAIHGGRIGPCAGSCGTAAFRAEPVFVSDISADPLWADYASFALRHDLRACWSIPVLSSAGNILGTFAFYLTRAGEPSPGQRQFVEQFASLASIAIELTRDLEGLRRSEAYLAEAQRLSRTGSFGWCIPGGNIVWSDETYRILGYDSAVEPGMEMVFDRVHPDDLVMVRKLLEGASEARSDFDFEHRLLMPDGTVKHVHVVARAVETASGEVEFVGAVMDVTGRKVLENRLRRSEQNLAEGQRLTRTGSWILDYPTGCTDWSVETCRIFGFPDPPPSPHYREFIERVRPEDREAVNRSLRESFETGEARPLSYMFVLPDGTRKNIETISEPVLNESGSVVSLMGTVMDVTDRQKAQDALRASELLARGQLNALARTLDALASESEPERFLDHVLRNITAELEAHSCSVWQWDSASGLMRFECAFEDGLVKSSADSAIGPVSPALRIEEVFPWPEIFMNGKPVVIPDIRCETVPWRDRLIGMGVVTILTVPMIVAARVEGVIGIRFTERRTFNAGELELAQSFANQAMLAMQINRLHLQSREAAVMAERNRMARDIHDTLAQGFTGVIVQLEAAMGGFSRDDNADVLKRIGLAGELARSSLAEARRSVQALRPLSLQGGSLSMALEDLLGRATDGTGIIAEFIKEGSQRPIPDDREEALLRIAQESITNTIKHSGARNLRALLVYGSDGLKLQITDDGRGFETATAVSDGFGLIGMRERIEGLNGTFELRSKPGQGTEIEVFFKDSIPGGKGGPE